MAQANPLLEEENVDENAGYVAFYQENHEFLRRVFLHQVPDLLKYEIGELFFGSSLRTSEWKVVVEELGVDHITVHGIEHMSKTSGDPPLYVALSKCLLSRASLGDVIEVFIRMQKYNLLRHLKPFAEGLLLRRNNGEGIRYEPHATAPDFNFHESYTSQVNCFLNETNYNARCGQLNSSEFMKKDEVKPSIIVNGLQSSEIISSSKSKHQISRVSNIQTVDVCSTVHYISVFIMHAMQDEAFAKKLASFLMKNNIQVIISAGLQSLLHVNHTKIMRGVFERVNFIIPMVSNFLITQVRFRGYNGIQMSDIESAANSFMYNLLLNEFSANGSENRRVIPVYISSEDMNAAYRDPILSYSLPLKKKKDILKILNDYKKYQGI
ncbi:uncharacterized protein NPIL_589021 [Nephila pilipes]|uniref:Uncharacterized protein n=1 Tax=Nephila pilipes TaxID=299642 RepID=A0A8X6NUT1_NEPPI|nr:uncharacterized protein NPIL_589021 [Nephila pilipes]